MRHGYSCNDFSELVPGIPVTQTRRRCTHSRQFHVVVYQGWYRFAKPLRGTCSVGNILSTPSLDNRQGIEPLLAITYRQWHINSRQSNGSQLSAGHGTRSSDREISGRISKIHSLDVSKWDVTGLALGSSVLRPVRVQNRNPIGQ